MATNHLGHFLLILLLLPALRRGAVSPEAQTLGFTPRIVNVASCTHYFGYGLSPTDPHFKQGPYDSSEAYGRSKLAQVRCPGWQCGPAKCWEPASRQPVSGTKRNVLSSMCLANGLGQRPHCCLMPVRLHGTWCLASGADHARAAAAPSCLCGQHWCGICGGHRPAPRMCHDGSGTLLAGLHSALLPDPAHVSAAYPRPRCDIAAT
jgi:hypothetical protein